MANETKDARGIDLELYVEVGSSVVRWYSLSVMIVASVVNPLSFIVFNRKAFRDSSTAVYLRFLAVMDCAATLTAMVKYHQLVQKQYFLLHDDLACQIHTFTRLQFGACSSWTLVAVSIERVISIRWPHKVKTICTKSVAILVNIGIFFFAGLSVLHVVFVLGDRHPLSLTSPNNRTTVHCTVVHGSSDISFMLFWTFVNVVTAILPCAALIVLSIIIMRGIVKIRKNVEKITKDSSKSDTKKRRRRIRENSLTITLISLNVTFFMFTFPSVIYAYFPRVQNVKVDEDVGITTRFLLLMLMNTNYAINFFLYCITGSRFRQELREAIRCVLGRQWSKILS